MIQRIPTIDWNPVIYSPESRFLYYLGNEGIYKTTMKIPVDSFLISNNYNDLSFNEKMEYNIITVPELMNSDDPYDLYKAGRYFQDNTSRKTDISEIMNSINTAEALFKKGLGFDTLQTRIACRLTELYIEKNQYSGFNLNREIDKCYNIMIKRNNPEDLLTALNFYGATVIAGNVDSSEIAYGYYDMMISISNKLLKISPENRSIRSRISRATSNLAFGLLDFKQYDKSIEAVKVAIEADSTFQYSYTNLPLAYIFNNQFDEAAKIYEEWKDKPWTVDAAARTFREIFLIDLDDLESRGITHPDFERARELLKKQ
jgi:tetratricopeptide (TPR) repeat protein